MRNKTQIPSSPYPSFLRLNFTALFLTCLPGPCSPGGVEGCRTGGLESAHNGSLLLLLLLPPHIFPVFQCGLLQGLQLPSKYVHLLLCRVLHRLHGNNLLHLGPLHRLQGNLCFGCWSTSSPSFFFHIAVHSFAFTPYCCAVLCPFLNLFSQRCHHLHWRAQLCPMVSLLEAAGTAEGTPAPP